MNQAVLMDTEVDECTELRDVADGTFKDHADLQILDVLNTVIEPRDLEVGARVTPRFFQLGKNVLHGDSAKFFVGKGFRLQCADHFAAAHHLPRRTLQRCEHALDHRVSFRVHARFVQGVVASTDAQKPGSLLESLGPEPANLHQLLAALERAIRVAPAHDVGRHRLTQARDAREQRRRRGV